MARFALGLGAVGSQSKDYYFIKKGYELIRTDVKRCFGWHTFKLDYSSGVDVKLYIDDELVATYDESDGVATSFDYIGMGDWEGKGGKAFLTSFMSTAEKRLPPWRTFLCPPRRSSGTISVRGGF